MMNTELIKLLPPLYIKKGEHHADCPFCGSKARKNKTHFSYSEKGYKCFVCGNGGGLAKLAKHLGAENYTPPPTPIKPPKATAKKPPFWSKWTREEYSRKFCGNAVSEWQKYKPIDEKRINHYSLGYGKLPLSRCNHNRLIVPIFDNGRLVNLRGRSTGCSCPKWLASGGWSLDNIALFNSHLIKKGDIVIVGENPVDAIMMTYNLNSMELLAPSLPMLAVERLLNGGRGVFVGVATLSTSYWNKRWLESVLDALYVIVMYDNDRGEVQAGPKAAKKIVQNIRGAGGQAISFDWGETSYANRDKFDAGDYIQVSQNYDRLIDERYQVYMESRGVC